MGESLESEHGMLEVFELRSTFSSANNTVWLLFLLCLSPNCRGGFCAQPQDVSNGGGLDQRFNLGEFCLTSEI